MALNAYLTAVQQLLGTGSSGNLYSASDLTGYINRARNQIAAEGECIRVLTPVAGPLTAISVTSGGSGYGNTTITIAAPDAPPGQGPFPSGQQATVTAITGAAGTITSVTINSAGNGYFAPGITISDVGTGAVLVAVVSGICQTSTGQEVYPFSQMNPVVASSGSGVSSIFRVNSISIIWGTFRYLLSRVSFSKYQAYVRVYTNQYQDAPVTFANYAQGSSGSVYVYPIPNQAYPMEWDAICLPSALATDTDPEAIPPLWQDAVAYLAAYYALNQAQRYQDADRMFKEYERWMKRARQMAEPRAVTNWYGRGF